MQNNLIILFGWMVLLAMACQSEVAPPEPFGAVPSQRQLQWHQLQYYAFIHFGPNTFTDIEWGHGDESPDVFDPSALDCDQWARIIKAAGMEGVVITAKHHDGFCLWPSQYSTHTVRESGWRNGQGDLLRELSDACRRHGLKFGVYVSPWDRNHPAYGTDEYNDIFKKMLTEVLTGYGDIYEVWFDGANGEGPNGKKQVYDFPGFAEVVREHQPMAVIFSDGGPDIRWIGNENGYAGEVNWCTVREGAFYPGIPGVNDQLQSGHEDGDTWLPAEVNTSIRPGWFYHTDEDNKVKSLNRLVDNWFHSVGMNGNYLLNIPVDDRGLIHPHDSARLMELKAWRDRAFGTDYIDQVQSVVASNTRGNADRYAPELVADGNRDTYWATDDGETKPALTLQLARPRTINVVLLQEFIALGQRVQSFAIDAWLENDWQEVFSSYTIGNRRLAKFPSVTTDRLRIRLQAKAAPLIHTIGLYEVPELLADPQLMRLKDDQVHIWSESPGLVYHYTFDGAEPDRHAATYSDPFAFDQAGTIRVRAWLPDYSDSSGVASFPLDISHRPWSLVGQDASTAMRRIIDGDPHTVWYTSNKGPVPVIDLGAEHTLQGFTYLPRQDGRRGGVINRFRLSLSRDGQQWKEVIGNDSFANILNHPVAQRIRFDREQPARYLRFQPVDDVEHAGSYGIAELGVLTK